MRAFVTGIAGFAGSHLAELLLGRGVEVHGLVLDGGDCENLEGCSAGAAAGRLHLHHGNVQDGNLLRDLVKGIRPEQVYHLAALSSVRRSQEDPGETFRVNVLGTWNVLEAVRHGGNRPRVLLVSSAEAYGESAQQPRPLREEDPLLPMTPYGASKAAGELLAGRYGGKNGLDIVRVRPFPHTGPRHAANFVFSDFAKQLAEIEAGVREPVIRTGNLDVRRDITDVRDMVRAYWLAVERGEGGMVYNVCSEAVYSLREVVERLRAQAPMAVPVVTEPGRLRHHDVQILWGSNQRFRERTGWTPEIPLERTLADLVAYWRARLPGVGGQARLGTRETGMHPNR
jgi:GDP-4-dehydro-6-deoxy-D-mannose reductase